MYPEPERQPLATPEAVDAFINRWKNASGTEKANYQIFLTELCTLLGLPQPEPACDTNADNAYVFERRVDIHKPDGSVNRGFIDLYKRGSFVLEAKQTGKTLGTSGWDKAMLAAQNQADQYVRALPTDEGRPGATTPLPNKPADQAEAEEERLCRLVALNHERAAEEAQGHIRWLRPDYQAPEATQTSAELGADNSAKAKAETDKPQTAAKQTWPKTMPEQVKAVQQLLAIGPQTQQALAEQFKRKPEKSVAQVLGALEVLGQASQAGELWQLGGNT